MRFVLVLLIFIQLPCLRADESKAQISKQKPVTNGLAPEIADLSADDVSYALEKNIPDLKKPYISTSPTDLADGVPVGTLSEGDKKRRLLEFAEEISQGKHGQIDSLLVFQNGKLLFESYYRRGRINYPHYQMSITKSYTALAVGRAIQLGHLKTSDLQKPIVTFLEKLDRDKLVAGSGSITLAAAMNMKSGIRVSPEKINELRRAASSLKGQGQIQAYLEHSATISSDNRAFKYQSSDPSIAMQVLEASVPGSAREFLKTELLGKLGITNFAWQNDVSGFPKAAAGSSMRSRDMLKWGMLVLNKGRWKGQQLVPEKFVEQATARIHTSVHTNGQATSYGYFWWRHNMRVGEELVDCKSGRGAGGQFILIFPKLDLIIVVTAHNKGMGRILKTTPSRLLPAFMEN